MSSLTSPSVIRAASALAASTSQLSLIPRLITSTAPKVLVARTSPALIRSISTSVSSRASPAFASLANSPIRLPGSLPLLYRHHAQPDRPAALLTAAARDPRHFWAASARHYSSRSSYSGSIPSTDPSQANLPWNTVIKFVPQQQSWVVERFGKFSRVLEPGLAVLVPFVERVAYVHTLKEVAVTIPSQSAITMDNVSLELDGVLYYRIVDPIKASYGVERPSFAVAQLAQTTMRAEIGRLTLDRMLAERAELNAHIVDAIGAAAEAWGIETLRYEVRDIHLPETVIHSMHSQVSAERSKRANILESEGQRQAAINVAEGEKRSRVLASEAQREAAINAAEGAARAVLLHADATAKGIAQVAQAISKGDGEGSNGADAAALQVAERWVDAWGGIAKNAGSVVVVPSGVGDAAGMVAQGLSVFKSLTGKSPTAVSGKLLQSAAQHGHGRDQHQSSGHVPTSSLYNHPEPSTSDPAVSGGSKWTKDVHELNHDIFEKTLKV